VPILHEKNARGGKICENVVKGRLKKGKKRVKMALKEGKKRIKRKEILLIMSDDRKKVKEKNKKCNL
jgi:hypothetical protein